MKEITRAVGAKGQITLPAEVREALGITGNGRITFAIDNGEVRLHPAGPSLDDVYQSVPALKRKLSVEQMIEIAAEEQALEAAKEVSSSASELWATYNPEQVRRALQASAGALAGVDRDALLDDLYAARSQESSGRPA